jgi:predicted Fe-Mo cluster-binding NifX family protein
LFSSEEQSNDISLKMGGSSEMKRVVVSSEGYDLDAPASHMFGRCPTYVFVDLDTMEFEAVDNPAANAAGGAGIQAAQYVVEQGVQAVLTGNVGPNAFEVFQSAAVPVFMIPAGTVRQAVEEYQTGTLQESGGANVGAHAGMRGGQRRSAKTAPTAPAVDKEKEVAELQKIAANLRRQLADVVTRINDLEETQ